MIIDHILHRELVDKGWSGDKKYRVTTDDGHVYLLRVSPKTQFERKHAQFQRMELAAGLGIPMCLPIEFGTCEDGVYSLQSWIDGQDAEAVLPSLSPKAQYDYGIDAGRILQKIHSLPAPEDVIPWVDRFSKKIDRKIAMYEACELKYEGGEAFLRHIEAARHLLSDRPQTFQHGDYHTGNMMIDKTGRLVIIDFEKDDFGDPWEEFNRIVWCAQLSPAFASGLVDGYFGGQVPMDFWDLLALYICSNSLGSLPWAIPFGEQEIQVMRNQAAEVLQWYDHFRSVIPGWYHSPQ